MNEIILNIRMFFMDIENNVFKDETKESYDCRQFEG